MNAFRIGILFCFSLWISFGQSQEKGNDSIQKNTIKSLMNNTITEEDVAEKIDRFDKWAYSDKEHATFFYFVPMYQFGVGSSETANNLHHDLGAIYRWYLADNDNFKMNIQGWLEQTSFWAGETTSDFYNKLNMISAPNASSETSHDLSLESLYAEFFVLDQKLDLTIGKFDPLYLTVFTNYSSWDKYNYFSKSTASDPIPDLDGGLGFYSEYHVSNNFSFGGLIVDGKARNNFLYVPKFDETTWNVMGFVRWKIGSKNGLYSSHNLAFYHQPAYTDNPEGNGFIYTGNQGLSKNTILVLKFSNGNGRVDKLNAAYVAGLTFLNPVNRNGDQAGFSTMINEKSGNYEYGIDTYWRFFINQYINIAPNFQAYYTVNKKINTVFGLRTFISY